jgi:hypothetical protein
MDDDKALKHKKCAKNQDERLELDNELEIEKRCKIR